MRHDLQFVLMLTWLLLFTSSIYSSGGSAIQHSTLQHGLGFRLDPSFEGVQTSFCQSPQIGSLHCFKAPHALGRRQHDVDELDGYVQHIPQGELGLSQPLDCSFQ